MRISGTLATLLALCFAAALGAQPPQESNVKRDEVVVFYPSYLTWDLPAGQWSGVIHGKVHEPEDATIAGLTLAAIRTALSIGGDLTPEQERTFKARTAGFRVDNERGKRIVVEAGGQRFVSERSGANGHFAIDVALASVEAGKELPFAARLAPGDERRFGGALPLLDFAGLSVISDIDDTVKVSNVLDRSELAANTFFRPFVAVSGMAERYGEWGTQGVAFHYVTASPWQLYAPLWEFLTDNGFPGVEIRMRNLRVKDWNAVDFFRGSQRYKLDEIRKILRRCPARRFVLVGDSGEHDPEVYAAAFREFPDRVAGILIRAVAESDLDRARYLEWFEGIDDSRWALFRDGAELPGNLPAWAGTIREEPKPD